MIDPIVLLSIRQVAHRLTAHGNSEETRDLAAMVAVLADALIDSANETNGHFAKEVMLIEHIFRQLTRMERQLERLEERHGPGRADDDPPGGQRAAPDRRDAEPGAQ